MTDKQTEQTANNNHDSGMGTLTFVFDWPKPINTIFPDVSYSHSVIVTGERWLVFVCP